MEAVDFQPFGCRKSSGEEEEPVWQTHTIFIRSFYGYWILFLVLRSVYNRFIQCIDYKEVASKWFYTKVLLLGPVLHGRYNKILARHAVSFRQWNPLAAAGGHEFWQWFKLHNKMDTCTKLDTKTSINNVTCIIHLFTFSFFFPLSLTVYYFI